MTLRVSIRILFLEKAQNFPIVSITENTLEKLEFLEARGEYEQ